MNTKTSRFPVYTRGNAGEVFPNVMTPMTGSLIGDASNDGQTRAMRDLGLLTDADLAGAGSPGSGVFHGYLFTAPGARRCGPRYPTGQYVRCAIDRGRLRGLKHTQRPFI